MYIAHMEKILKKIKTEQPVHMRMPLDVYESVKKLASKQNRKISNMIVTLVKESLTKQ